MARNDRAKSDPNFSAGEPGTGVRNKTVPASVASPDVIGVSSERSVALLVAVVVAIALLAIPFAAARWAALLPLAFVALGFSWLNCRRIELRADGVAILHDEGEEEIVPIASGTELASAKRRRFGPIETLVLTVGSRTVHARLVTLNHAGMDAVEAGVQRALLSLAR